MKRFIEVFLLPILVCILTISLLISGKMRSEERAKCNAYILGVRG